MKCEKCNSEIKDNLVACPSCGYELENKDAVKNVSLKCEHCGGDLTVDNDKPILNCPYCGNQSLIIENDAVTIERIKSAANKEIEIEKVKSNERMHKIENEKEQKLEEKVRAKKFAKSPWAIFLIIALIVSGFFSFVYFVSGCVLAGILSIVQMICFGCAWSMGINIIKGKKYLHILVAIIGILLILPTILACNVASMNANAHKIEWNIILLGDKIPEPNSLKVEIHNNTEDELWIEIYSTSEEEYYEYTAACKEWGYVVEMSENSVYYNAYNDEGYEVSVSYSDYNRIMSIRLDVPTEVYDLKWNEHEVASILPEPLSTLGLFLEENESTNKIIVSNTSEEDFKAYCDACIEAGFDIDSESSTTSYQSYDAKGNKITISYNSGNKEMNIDFKYPMEFREITWPIVGVGTLAPIPLSLSGNVSNDFGWVYSVYLENVSKEEYENYVQECIDCGFDKDISNYGDSFQANYSDEISINVAYEGIDIMYIYVSGSVTEDYSSLTRENEEDDERSQELQETQRIEEKEDSESKQESEEQEKIEEEKESQEPIVSEMPVSEYEKAYVRKLSDYSLYIMFDEDTKEVVSFGTMDTYVMSGSYSGSFSNGVIISWDDGWNEMFTHSGNTVVLTDGNGIDWDYRVCNVSDAQGVLDDLR